MPWDLNLKEIQGGQKSNLESNFPNLKGALQVKQISRLVTMNKQPILHGWGGILATIVEWIKHESIYACSELADLAKCSQ